MRQLSKSIHFFSSAMLFVSLSSCSFSIESFIRNFSTDPLTVVIHIPSKISLQTTSIPFTSKILKIHKNAYKSLNDSLRITRIDNTSISFIVPGNSTALLWPALSVHLDSLYFATAILKQGNFSDTVRLDSKEKLKSAFQTVYYDFKSQTK